MRNEKFGKKVNGKDGKMCCNIVSMWCDTVWRPAKCKNTMTTHQIAFFRWKNPQNWYKNNTKTILYVSFYPIKVNKRRKLETVSIRRQSVLGSIINRKTITNKQEKHNEKNAIKLTVFCLLLAYLCFNALVCERNVNE